MNPTLDKYLTDAELPEIERGVLEKAYGLDKTGKRCTATEIASALSISASQVALAERDALEILVYNTDIADWLESQEVLGTANEALKGLFEAVDQYDADNPAPYRFKDVEIIDETDAPPEEIEEEIPEEETIEDEPEPEPEKPKKVVVVKTIRSDYQDDYRQRVKELAKEGWDFIKSTYVLSATRKKLDLCALFVRGVRAEPVPKVFTVETFFSTDPRALAATLQTYLEKIENEVVDIGFDSYNCEQSKIMYAATVAKT